MSLSATKRLLSVSARYCSQPSSRWARVLGRSARAEGDGLLGTGQAAIDECTHLALIAVDEAETDEIFPAPAHLAVDHCFYLLLPQVDAIRHGGSTDDFNLGATGRDVPDDAIDAGGYVRREDARRHIDLLAVERPSPVRPFGHAGETAGCVLHVAGNSRRRLPGNLSEKANGTEGGGATIGILGELRMVPGFEQMDPGYRP